MKKVLLFSLLLIIGLALSQVMPQFLGDSHKGYSTLIRILTMIGLAFIMIHVGYEFEIDKSNMKSYGWDYVVAMTAAAFPWIFVTLYFVFVLLPPEFWTNMSAWKETLLAGRFAAPTSAGVLFSMLAAAGLSATWLYRKTRILAIFDDLDTVLLMIPLKIMMVGLAWQLGIIVVLMFGLLALGWVFLHKWKIPITWPWVLGYATTMTLISEAIYKYSKLIDDSVPIHIEILLPAFVLGAMMARPRGADPHSDDAREGHQDGPESETEQLVSTIVAAAFMLLVGLSFPALFGSSEAVVATKASGIDGVLVQQPPMGVGEIIFHVIMVTIISNLGKMFPVFCYSKEASFNERLAVSIGMWPRGEVGAGILVVSLSYGIGGPVITIAVLSLALNLLLTGVFILMVKKLIRIA